MTSRAELTAEIAVVEEGGCEMTRKTGAAFAVTLVLTCALVSILPDAVCGLPLQSAEVRIRGVSVFRWR